MNITDNKNSLIVGDDQEGVCIRACDKVRELKSLLPGLLEKYQELAGQLTDFKVDKAGKPNGCCVLLRYNITNLPDINFDRDGKSTSDLLDRGRYVFESNRQMDNEKWLEWCYKNVTVGGYYYDCNPIFKKVQSKAGEGQAVLVPTEQEDIYGKCPTDYKVKMDALKVKKEEISDDERTILEFTLKISTNQQENSDIKEMYDKIKEMEQQKHQHRKKMMPKL